MGWFRGREDKEPLRELIGDYDLPHFPSATLATLDVLRDEEAPLSKVTETLQVDPGLSVRVLKLVNSAGFGLRHPVEDLAHAVQLVGRSSLESMLIALGVRRALPSVAGDGLDAARFWRRCARRALVARALAAQICPSESSFVFTAALLEEMAVPLLVDRQGDAYTAVLDRWREGEGALHELERESFGWDHAEVGGAMCRAWGLPEALSSVVGDHHRGPDAESAPTAPILLTADLGEQEDGEDLEALIERAHEDHGLDPEALRAVLADAVEEAGSLAQLFA